MRKKQKSRAQKKYILCPCGAHDELHYYPSVCDCGRIYSRPSDVELLGASVVLNYEVVDVS